MKKLTLLSSALFISAVFLFSSCTIKQINGQNRQISVTGTGSVSVDPDFATITMSVRTSAKELTAATKENAEIMEAVTNALIANGLSKEDISTKDYDIYQETHWENNHQVRGNYQVSNKLSAIVRKISNAGTIIDAAVKAGANEFSSLSFGVTDTAEALKQARILAMKNAEETAKLLAETGGADIGKIISIDEIYEPKNNTRTVKMNAMMLADSAVSEAATGINAGKTDISVTVNVTYALK